MRYSLSTLLCYTAAVAITVWFWVTAPGCVQYDVDILGVVCFFAMVLSVVANVMGGVLFVGWFFNPEIPNGDLALTLMLLTFPGSLAIFLPIAIWTQNRWRQKPSDKNAEAR